MDIKQDKELSVTLYLSVQDADLDVEILHLAPEHPNFCLFTFSFFL